MSGPPVRPKAGPFWLTFLGLMPKEQLAPLFYTKKSLLFRTSLWQEIPPCGGGTRWRESRGHDPSPSFARESERVVGKVTGVDGGIGLEPRGELSLSIGIHHGQFQGSAAFADTGRRATRKVGAVSGAPFTASASARSCIVMPSFANWGFASSIQFWILELLLATYQVTGNSQYLNPHAGFLVSYK